MPTRPVDPRYHTARWQRLRTKAIARDGRRCATHGCVSDMTLSGMVHVDHIIEEKDGGPFWDLGNLQVLCKIHHDAKSGMVRAQRLAGREPVSTR